MKKSKKEKLKPVCNQCHRSMETPATMFYRFQKIYHSLDMLLSEECITEKTHEELVEELLWLKTAAHDYDDKYNERD